MQCTYCGKLFNIIIWCTKRGQPDLLGEQGKVRVTEQWGMAQQLVTYVSTIDNKEQGK